MTKLGNIVLLGGDHDSTWIMYNALCKTHVIDRIIIERGGRNRKAFIKRRIKRLGYISVLGQGLFSKICVPHLNREAATRLKEIKEDLGLDESREEGPKVTYVKSVNSEKCKKILQKIVPKVVVVNGTRIIHKKILNAIPTTFINTHVGITPKYRGVHGGYWALSQQDKENCGVTVHLVDPGIDTGGILYQATIKTTSRDNFVTYPLLQVAKGAELMAKAITDALEDKIQPITPRMKESALWYHPTIWYYLYKRWIKGVK